MPDQSYFDTLIWQIADLLRGPYRPPQYERVILPMTVLRRFDCVLASTKNAVMAEYDRRKDSKVNNEALDTILNNITRQSFHNHSPLDFEKLKGDRSDDRSIKLNDQWRLTLRSEADEQGNFLLIIDIEDYHKKKHIK